MRNIEIVDDLKLRFPQRDREFDLGVEVGSITVLIAQGVAIIEREISPEALEQLEPIAKRFGYSIVRGDVPGNVVHVSFERFRRKPRLRVV
jgi:hypothetical protein